MNSKICCKWIVFILLGILATTVAKKSEKFDCPEKQPGCVSCTCKKESGFSSCTATKCPAHPKTVKDAVVGKKEGKCPHGLKFKAECAGCECDGKEGQCILCSALPVKRPSQSDDVNKKLPWINDARINHYEVSGWSKEKEE